MTLSSGFPDYQRVKMASGSQLYVASGSIPVNTELFRTYVGAYPYVNVYADLDASADTARIRLIYTDDSLGTNDVGFRYAIRQGGNFSSVQYASLGPWLYLDYLTLSGNPMSFAGLAVYGSTGPATQPQLASTDVPILEFNQNVASNAVYSQSPVHIQPGPATMMLYTTALSFTAVLYYWDYVSAAWVQVWHADNTSGISGVPFSMPMIDAPYKMSVNNTDSVPRGFVCSWQSG